MSDKPSETEKENKEEDEHNDEPGAIPSIPNTPTESRARIGPGPSKPSRKKKTRKDSWATSRQRPPTPFPKNRRVKGCQSLQETALQPVNNAVVTPVESTKAKSTSMDAMGFTKTDEEQDSLRNNNNNKSVSSQILKGRVFRSNKVTPDRLEGVITISPVICVSGQQHCCLGPCVHANSINHSQLGVGESLGASKSNDSMEVICRICHDSPSTEKLIKPCRCKGSMGPVHRTCLERWLGESGKGACEICGQEYNTVRVPKYKGIRSIIAWIRNPLTPSDSRNFFFDVACFFILTPLACLSAWLCVVGAQNYAFEQNKAGHKLRLNAAEPVEIRANRDASNSTWTSVGLLSLTGTLVAAYYIWIFVAIRYHLQVWREWQQRNFIVSIVPLANGDFSFSPPPPERQGTERREDHLNLNEEDSETSLAPARGQHSIQTLILNLE